MTISSMTVAVLLSMFVSTTTAAGAIVITGFSKAGLLIALGFLLTTIVIPAIVNYIKTKLPQKIQIAWIPVVLGSVLWIAGGLVTGQITNWITLIVYIVFGLSSGGLASSVRDIWKGK